MTSLRISTADSVRRSATGFLSTNFNKTAIAIAISTALGSLTQVQAQESAEVIDVVGASQGQLSSMRFQRSLLDTAQTVNVISKDLITERAATSLRDVLRNVSGISMQAGEGGAPPGDQMSIRGFSARTDIFVDNVRDFGAYSRDPFNLEQVEVVKGPSSDYSGRGSTGGSINLVSKTPGLRDNSSGSVALGSDTYRRLSLDTNHVLRSIDNAAARLNLLYHEQKIPGRDYVENERFGIAPSISFGLNTDTQVTFSLFHMQQNNVPDYGIPWVPGNNVPLADYANQAPPVDFDNWYGLLERDHEDLRTSMATVSFEQNLSANIALQNVTRWGETYRDSLVTAPRFLSADSTDVRRSDEKYRDQQDDIISNQTNLSMVFNTQGGGEHRVLLGAEFNLEGEKRYTQELLGSDSPATDLFDPAPFDPYLENYQRTGTASSSDSDTVALYLSDSYRINEYWQVNGGLRWDQFSLEYTPDGEAQIERTDRMLSYRAGVVYKPVEQGSIYLGYGTSFNPSAEALSLSSGRRTPGLPELDPEENRTFEAGAKWEILNRRMLISGAYFRTEKTNARTQDPDNPDDLLVLQGEQLVEGIELGVSGNISERFSVFAGYTHMSSEIVSSLDAAEIGKELPNSPENSFNLWGNYLIGQKLELGFGAQYVGERTNSTSVSARRAPDYWVYEASANYALNERVNVRFNLHNITDERYIDFVGGGHFIPGAGRMVLLTTNFSF